MSNYNYIANFSTRTDLKKYNSNDLLLYALQLRFDIDDIDSVAADALTDGSNDKKCDLVYIDETEGIAVIAQSYKKDKPQDGKEPKANKASDLNTAATWILGHKTDDLPECIKGAAELLHSAIHDEKISTIQFWYVHNCEESKNVQSELDAVATTAKAIMKRHFPECNVDVLTFEVGNNTIEKWFDQCKNKILVNENIDIPLPYGGYSISTDKWTAFQTCISGRQLYELHKSHGDDLFSANPRRFLGTGTRKNPINLGIKDSAQKKPKDFWAYNNGITALVNHFSVDKDVLRIKGISIINGAQTTGSIGQLPNIPDESLIVSIRFIVCKDKPTILEIINNNNRQNEMVPSDFRSNDQIQSRLRKEFDKYPTVFYNGGLRSDKWPRNKKTLDSGTVAQVLTAFCGDPIEAYNNKKGIWADDKLYSTVFNDALISEHIMFVYSLFDAINALMYKFKQKSITGEIIKTDVDKLSFLSRRGSRILLLSAIANSFETIIQTQIKHIHRLRFKDNTNYENLVNNWIPIVEMALPLCTRLEPALAGGLNNKEKAKESIIDFRSNIDAIKAYIRTVSDVFVSQIDLN